MDYKDVNHLIDEGDWSDGVTKLAHGSVDLINVPAVSKELQCFI